MRRLVALAFAAGLALVGGRAVASELPWATGWDNFSEPLNKSTSFVHWSLSPGNPFLTVTYQLNGAAANKLYQIGIHLENCRKAISSFGQFPALGGPCSAITRQGITKTVEAFEFGVVLTDAFGNGRFAVIVGPIVAGTYALQFNVRNGAGCNVTGGGSGGAVCEVDFQAPNHFGNTITLKVP
jgi:hypothetical protein